MATPTPWLDESEQRAWRAYLRMSTQLTAHLARQLAASSDLSTADFGVLVQLTDNPDGRCRAYVLGRELQWEKSRLSHHLTRMERRGLVARSECRSDGRGAYVAVTEAGRAALEAAAPAHAESVRHAVFDGLTPEQVAAFADVSERVLARLEPDGGCDGPADCGPTGEPECGL